MILCRGSCKWKLHAECMGMTAEDYRRYFDDGEWNCPYCAEGLPPSPKLRRSGRLGKSREGSTAVSREKEITRRGAIPIPTNTEEERFDLANLEITDTEGTIGSYLSPGSLNKFISEREGSVSRNRALGEELERADCAGWLSPSTMPVPLAKGGSMKQEIFGKGLVIAHCNVNGIKSKFEEIKELLYNNNCLFLGITETKLEKDDTYPIMVTGYEALRLDRVRSGGGCVIYVKQGVVFTREELPLFIKFTKETEVTLLSVKMVGIKEILILLIYNPPKNPKSEFIDSLTQLLNFLQSKEVEYIVLGDFNIDLLDSNTNTYKLRNMSREFGIKQMITNPTRRDVTKKGVTNTLLDHIYVNKVKFYAVTGQFPFAGSDHDLTFVTRKLAKVKIQPNLIYARSFAKIDWGLAENLLSTFDFKYLSEEDVDTSFEQFRVDVGSIVNALAPLKTRNIRGKRDPWFGDEQRFLMKERDSCKAVLDKTGTQAAAKNYRVARNKANMAMSMARTNYFLEDFVTACKQQTMWTTVDKLTGYKRKARTAIMILRLGENAETSDRVLIFKKLAEAFIVSSTSLCDDSLKEREINSYCETYKSGPVILSIKETEVEEAIKRLSEKSSNSEGGIPAIFIKRASPVFISALTLLFNAIFSQGEVPRAFKVALVTPLYKGKGPMNLAESYRPISVLNPITKVFETVLFNRLKDNIEPLLCNQQHGFRPKRSCQTALTLFTQEVFEGIDGRNSRVGAVFVDLKKAFNSINHTLLLSKLIKRFKLCPEYVKLIRSYLENRNFHIKNGEQVSEAFKEDGSVPQGSKLGPLLFAAFFNDVAIVFKELNIPSFFLRMTLCSMW